MPPAIQAAAEDLLKSGRIENPSDQRVLAWTLRDRDTHKSAINWVTSLIARRGARFDLHRSTPLPA